MVGAPCGLPLAGAQLSGKVFKLGWPRPNATGAGDSQSPVLPATRIAFPTPETMPCALVLRADEVIE